MFKDYFIYIILKIIILELHLKTYQRAYQGYFWICSIRVRVAPRESNPSTKHAIWASKLIFHLLHGFRNFISIGYNIIRIHD